MYFPELMPIGLTESIDVSLRLGHVPNHSAEEIAGPNQKVFINEFCFKLYVPNIAKYWAESGSTIIIEKSGKVDDALVRLFCLSNVFAAVLYQRGIFPLHSAAIKIENHLVLICGHSGAGKSTLLASLISKGFKIFSDDVCVPYISSSGQVFMHSSYPMMKFWKDSLECFPILGNPDIQLRPEYDKYGIFFHNEFKIKASMPLIVFFLEKSSENRELCFREIKGVELFQKLESNAYRGEYLAGFDLKRSHFELFTSLANQLKSYVIERPKDINTIVELADKAEEIIRNKM